MRKWLLTFAACLMLCSFSVAQRGRACKLPVYDHLSGCILCGNYQTSGYCACKIDIPCSDAPGADVMEFIGNCVVGQYCGATVAESAAAAITNQAKYAYWLKSTNVSAVLEADHPIIKRAFEAIQGSLLRSDVSACSWASATDVLRNRQNPSEPIYAELKNMGNSYKLDVRFESDKGPRWTLHLFPNGWVLQDGDRVNLLSGTY